MVITNKTLGLVLSPKMLRYLLHQKTQLQHPIGKLLWKWRMGKLYDTVLIPVLERPRFAIIAEEFSNRCRRQYEDLKPYLPTSPKRVLDIGAGIGGVDVYLHNHYNDPEIEFWLLERSGMSKSVFYGLTEKRYALQLQQPDERISRE